MKRLLVLLLSFGTSAFALVERTLDEKKPIDALFSTTSHNRIAIEEGAVEKVFADSSLFSIAIDSTTGNAFVNVEKEILDPVTMTVVTSSGAVQDLLIRSGSVPSEQICLHLPEDGESWALSFAPSLAGSIATLNQILDGSIPPGFGQREQVNELSLPSPLIALPLRSLEGPFEILDVYEIRNPGKKPAPLSSEEIKGDGAWAFLSARILEQGDKAICIIGRSKDG